MSADMMLSLDTLNALPAAEFAEKLSAIYEHSPWVAQAVAGQRPFPTVAALAQAMAAAVHEAGAERQDALIRNHPDLAGKAARAGTLTAHSTQEQASAGLDRLNEAEFAAFNRLNEAYKARFGFPFIICVRRHSKASILAQFEKRLAHDAAAERQAALQEIGHIALLRLSQSVEGPGAPALNGRLSTHVLDNHAGKPAAGIGLRLFELSPHAPPRLVAQAITNHDGRTDSPLIAGRPLPMGQYELVFDTAAYFAARGVPLADPPFLGEIPIRFSIAEPEGHYHVPLLVTPWSYSTYRGS